MIDPFASFTLRHITDENPDREDQQEIASVDVLHRNILAKAGLTTHRIMLAELGEEVLAVVRAGGGLGVVLDAEDRQAGVAEPFEGLVVEVDVAGLDVGGRVAGSTAKPWFWVVISTLPVRSLRTGWLAPRWPNLSLKVLRAEGLAEELVAQADAEDRDARATRRPS